MIAELRAGGGPGFSGVTAVEVAARCGISRENASRELNRLCAEGSLVKSAGRPVRFDLAAAGKDQAAGAAARGEQASPGGHARQLGTSGPGVHSDQPEAFRKIIGYDGTLQVVVEKAKAAMIYPGGLHTLITGPTGSGKTMLAHAMHDFAVQSGSLPPSAPLVVFNCAEYARNEELLASHLFGHVKGAFTGADSDRAGLIERADGGILLLDEVHRLPPSAQEMLFLLMDSGIYRRVGESRQERRAGVTIISCTTEVPDSALLQTFLRRVPVLINMPAFGDWSVGERVLVVRHLLAREADHLGRPVSVDQVTFDRWVDFRGDGNLGHLRSVIQLAVAKALLKSGAGRRVVCVGAARDAGDGSEPLTVRPGLPQGVSQRNILNELSQMMDSGARMDEAFSSVIEHLETDGRSTLQRKARSGAAGLVEYLVPGHIRRATTRALESASGLLGVTFDSAHHLRLALHLAAAIGRLDSAGPAEEFPAAATPAQRTAAETVLRGLEEDLGVEMPAREMVYLTRFLISAMGEYAGYQASRQAAGKPVILATCYSGEGAAARIRDTLRSIFGDSVSVVCCGERGIDRLLDSGYLNPCGVVAAIGSVDPRLPGVPFIPVEDLVMGDGLKELVDLLGLDPARMDTYEFSMAGSLTMDTLLDSMVFLNPHKALSEAETFVRTLESGLGRSFSKAVRVRLMVHTACMLERLVTRKSSGSIEGAATSRHIGSDDLQGLLAQQVRCALAHVESSFELKVPDDEVLILSQIIESELP